MTKWGKNKNTGTKETKGKKKMKRGQRKLRKKAQQKRKENLQFKLGAQQK